MNEVERHRAFMELFMGCQHDIRAYLAASLYGWDQVDDVMQEVATVLWTQFDRYNDDYPFGAWARGIARNLLYKQYSKNKRNEKLLSENALMAIEDAFREDDLGDDFDQERHALRSCLDNLSERARSLVQLRYFKELGLNEIADEVGSSFEAVKKALTRTRKQLVECCQRDISRQEVGI